MGFMAKIAVLNDVHLSARNIGYSKDYVNHTLRQLDEFIDYVEQNEITHVILAGDFWDSVSIPDKFKGQVFKRLRRLKKLVVLLAVRGNHEKSTKTPYTSYDITMDAGLFEYEPVLDFGDIQLRLFKYTENIEDLRIENAQELIDNGKHIISVYHQNIVNSEILDLPIGIVIEPSETDVFYGVELGLVAHIHTPMGLFESVNSGWKTKWFVAGSHGRDQYKKGQIRDDYILQIITIDEDGKDYEFSYPSLPLVPVSEFFDTVRALEEKRKKIDLDSFTESMKTVEIDFIDAAEEIAKLDNVEESVKTICYSLLGRTPSLQVKESKKVNIDASRFADNDLNSEF